MNAPTITDEDRHVVRILAFAGREFDRAHDVLVGDDEPGEQEVADGAGQDDTQDETDTTGRAGRALRSVGGIAQAAGRAVTGSVHPRHPDWEAADLDERIDWWVQRFGTAAAALAAVPGLGGKLGRLTAAPDVIGASAQILVVNAIAHEVGVTDVATRVAVASRIVLERELDTQALAAVIDDPDDPDEEMDDEVAGDAPEERSGPLARVGRTASLVWRVAGRIRRLRSDLGNRPQGGLAVRALSNLPAIGVAGAFLSERRGITLAAQEARAAFTPAS